MIFGNERRTTRWAVLVLLGIAFLVTPARAQAPWTIERLMHELQQVKSATARFVQLKYLAALTAPLQSSGALIYAAPDKIEMKTERPKPETIAIAGDQLITVSNNGRQRRFLSLDDYPEAGAIIESIRSTLSGNLPGLQRFYDVHLDGDETSWTLSLVPTLAKLHETIDSVVIQGSANAIRSIEIREIDGDRSVMTVTPDNP